MHVEYAHAVVEFHLKFRSQASMAVTAGTELRRPDRYEDFETRCMALGKAMINSPNVTKNGRKGQPQKGVDVWGYRDGRINHVVGIQCKLKGIGHELTESEVREEWKAALAFNKNLREYFILTTAENDGKMEELARDLALELFEKEERSVEFYIWGWGRINDEVVGDPALVRIFDPDYGVFSSEHSEKLDGVVEAHTRTDVKIDVMTEMMRKVMVAVKVEDLDVTVGGAEVDKVLDAGIDANRSLIHDGLPRTALTLFEKMLAELEGGASGRIVFRIKANMGACHLALEQVEKGCELLLSAYEHAPSEPKAIANRVLAHLLAGHFEEVLKIGREQLSADLAHEETWSYVVQAAAKTGFTGDPLSLVPERHHASEAVLVSLVHFKRMRGGDDWWEDAAHAYALHPDSRHAKQFYADSILEQIGKTESNWSSNAVPEHLKPKLESAAELYAEIWQEATKGENVAGDDDLGVLANYFVALRLLNRYADAIAMIENERAYVTANQGVLLRAAIVAYEADSDLADELFSGLEAGSAASMLRIQLLLRRADWAAIARLPDQVADDVEDPEKPVCKAALAMCRAWMLSDGPPDHQDIDQIIADASGDARASILIADLCQAWGMEKAANKAWENGRRSITATSHWSSRVMVAKHAYRLGRHRDAADLYFDAIDLTVDSEELRHLTAAVARELPQTGRGARFFRELPAELKQERYYRQYEAVMHFNSGDMKRAEKAARSGLNDFRRLDTFRLLVATLQRSDRQDKIRGLLNSYDVLSLEGSDTDRMFAAQVLHRFGRVPEALRELYSLYISNRNDPDIALAFFITMVQQSSYKHTPRPRTVSLDAWVQARDDAGHEFEFVVGEDSSVGDGILPPLHPFVQAAFGRAVGDTFSIARGVGDDVTWTVCEIRHRWAHAAREIGQNFETWFPDENGVYSYTMKNDDIQPMLDLVKRQAEANEQFAQQHADGMPLALISARLHREPISLAEFIRSLGREVRTCLGNAQERAVAFDLIENHRAGGAVLDTYTAWTAAVLDLLPVLKQLFGSLYITQSVKDEILLLKGFDKPRGKELSLVYHEGQYIRHETKREEVLRRRDAIAEELAKIEKICELVPVSAPRIEGEAVKERTDILDMAVEMFGPGVVDPAAVAAGGCILLSEDMNYRGFANTIWPVRSTWLQPALTMATAKGLMSFPEYAKKLAGLARLRHGFISFDPQILIEILGKGDETALSDFAAAAHYIGSEGADLQSHVAVTVGFIDGILQENALPFAFRLKAISIILEKLIRHQPEHYGRILVGVVVGCEKEGQSVVAGWIEGHCMLPEVELRYEEYRRRTLPLAIRSILRRDLSFVGNVWRLSAPRPPKLPGAFRPNSAG